MTWDEYKQIYIPSKWITSNISCTQDIVTNGDAYIYLGNMVPLNILKDILKICNISECCA